MLVRVVESNCVDVDDEIVVTGIFGQIHSDISYRFNGKIVSHPNTENNSKQIIINRRNQPEKEGSFNICLVLIFQGLGKKTAEKIIEKLGEEAMECILNDETALDGITGLTKKKKK